MYFTQKFPQDIREMLESRSQWSEESPEQETTGLENSPDAAAPHVSPWPWTLPPQKRGQYLSCEDKMRPMATNTVCEDGIWCTCAKIIRKGLGGILQKRHLTMLRWLQNSL